MHCVILSALAVSGTVFGADRLSTSEKGSLLIFSDIAGNLDGVGLPLGGPGGYMVISNDFPEDVRLQSYVVNNQACEAYDMAFSLTANQVAAFYGADLSAPFGDCDSLSVYVWAVNSDNAQIRWNHLSGYSENGNATAAAALVGDHGDTVGVAGTINMDGVEYASAYAGVTVNFQADFGGMAIELLDKDFADKTADPATTKIVAEIWNMDEVKFSGTSRCVTCFESADLSSWSDSSVNFFRGAVLGTDFGKARLFSEANGSCGETSAEHAFHVQSAQFPEDMGIVGTGSSSATLTYNLESEPDEAGKLRKNFGLLRK
jgi:FlaG/FlaF family flagellin (archaellin)